MHSNGSNKAPSNNNKKGIRFVPINLNKSSSRFRIINESKVTNNNNNAENDDLYLSEAIEEILTDNSSSRKRKYDNISSINDKYSQNHNKSRKLNDNTASKINNYKNLSRPTSLISNGIRERRSRMYTNVSIGDVLNINETLEAVDRTFVEDNNKNFGQDIGVFETVYAFALSLAGQLGENSLNKLWIGPTPFDKTFDVEDAKTHIVADVLNEIQSLLTKSAPRSSKISNNINNNNMQLIGAENPVDPPTRDTYKGYKSKILSQPYGTPVTEELKYPKDDQNYLLTVLNENAYAKSDFMDNKEITIDEMENTLLDGLKTAKEFTEAEIDVYNSFLSVSSWLEYISKSFKSILPINSEMLIEVEEGDAEPNKPSKEEIKVKVNKLKDPKYDVGSLEYYKAVRDDIENMERIYDQYGDSAEALRGSIDVNDDEQKGLFSKLYDKIVGVDVEREVRVSAEGIKNAKAAMLARMTAQEDIINKVKKNRKENKGPVKNKASVDQQSSEYKKASKQLKDDVKKDNSLTDEEKKKKIESIDNAEIVLLHSVDNISKSERREDEIERNITLTQISEILKGADIGKKVEELGKKYGLAPKEQKNYTLWTTTQYREEFKYFNPTAKTAIETSFRDIKATANMPELELFDLISHDEVKDYFAELSALYLNKAKIRQPSAYTQVSRLPQIEVRINLLKTKFKDLEYSRIDGRLYFSDVGFQQKKSLVRSVNRRNQLFGNSRIFVN